MKFTRVDALIAAVAVLFAAALAGMLTNLWLLALLPIPVLAGVLLVLGSLNRHNRLGIAALPVAVFTVILVGLFGWVAASVDSGGKLGGLPITLGVIYLVLWPFITITTGLLYAFVYERWLKRDLDLVQQ